MRKALIKVKYAPVAELADALDLGSSVPDVKVQVLSGAPSKEQPVIAGCFFDAFNKRGLEPQGGTQRLENSAVHCF